MNRGTHCGDDAEKEFVKRFNRNKNDNDFSLYIKDCNVTLIDDVYMIRVNTKQYSKLSNQVVMTRADTYLVESKDDAIKQLLFDNDYYLDENMLNNDNIKFNPVEYSGVSVKMSDSDKFQILKLTPDSFKTLFGNYELGAGASVYCLKEEEINKNKDVLKGWKTTEEDFINFFSDELPIVNNLDKDIPIIEQMRIFKIIKEFSNAKIKELIDNDKEIQEIIFNGYHIYEEPYSATHFYHGGIITELNYIPFTVTTGSGRSKGIYTIVFKPKNETIN